MGQEYPSVGSIWLEVPIFKWVTIDIAVAKAIE